MKNLSHTDHPCELAGSFLMKGFQTCPNCVGFWDCIAFLMVRFLVFPIPLVKCLPIQLRRETDPVYEMLCSLVFRILDDGHITNYSNSE
jgi:hypothetical protein